jgi:hypothetical protein
MLIGDPEEQPPPKSTSVNDQVLHGIMLKRPKNLADSLFPMFGTSYIPAI